LLLITLNDIVLYTLLITTPSRLKFEFNEDLATAYNNRSSIVSGKVNSVSILGKDRNFLLIKKTF